MANALAGLGVGAGDRVALMFSNDFRFLESLFGPMRLGAVAVPLNIADGGRRAPVRGRGRRGGGHDRRTRPWPSAPGGLAARVPRLKHLIVEGPAADGALEYGTLLAAASPALGAARPAPDEICMQPYTSGSTGKPKGVLLAHGGQIWNADIMRKSACSSTTRSAALVAVPLYHKNAMVGAVKPFLLAGGSLVILPGFDAVEVIRAHRPPPA